MKTLTTLIVFLLLLTGCEKEPKNKCPMYKLEQSVFLFGNQIEACALLGTLQRYSLLPAPVEIADMKAVLDAGQTQPLDSAAFDSHLNQLYSLPIDTSALTAAERSVLNTIFAHLNPSPVNNCCGGTDYPSTSPIQNPSVNPDVDINVYPRLGSTTFEHTVEFTFKSLISCEVHDIEITGLLGIAGPSPTTIILNDAGCINGKRTFRYLYLTFATDPYNPVGSFSGTANFRDSTGATLSSSSVEWAF